MRAAHRPTRAARGLGVFGVALCLLVPGPAWTHGGAGIDEDPCVQRAGIYLIHFAAYQPQVDPTGEYCDAIPKAQNAIFVFDFVDRELRKEMASIRIERRQGEAEVGETLMSIPAKLYPTGVVNTEFQFDGPGEYAAVVTLEELERVIRFPLRVEMFSYEWVPTAGFALLVGLPLGFLLVRRIRRSLVEGV